MTIGLDQHAFAVYDTNAREWAVVPGAYKVIVGDSSVNQALVSRVDVRAASAK
jgi:hypothetical protein